MANNIRDKWLKGTLRAQITWKFQVTDKYTLKNIPCIQEKNSVFARDYEDIYIETYLNRKQDAWTQGELTELKPSGHLRFQPAESMWEDF